MEDLSRQDRLRAEALKQAVTLFVNGKIEKTQILATAEYFLAYLMEGKL